jgi:hypothetical protein
VAVALVGDEPGIAEAAAEFGFTALPQVAVNALGTPLISSIFALGRGLNDSPYLAYLNADILLFPDFVDCTCRVGAELERFLMVGRRWDLRWKKRCALNLRGRPRLSRNCAPKAACMPAPAAITSSFRAPVLCGFPISQSGVPAGITG